MTINNAVLEKVQSMSLKPTVGDTDAAAEEVVNNLHICKERVTAIYDRVADANGEVTYETLIRELSGAMDNLVTQATNEMRFQLRQREMATDAIADKAAEILLAAENDGAKMTTATAICLAQYPEHILDAIRDEVDRIVGSQ